MTVSLRSLLALAALAAQLAAGGAEPCPAAAPRRADYELDCTLPRGTRLQLAARGASYVTLDCGGGAYACAELPRAPPAPAPPRAGLAHCALPRQESLACTLDALGAPAAAALTLRAVPGGAAASLRPHHVRGLPALASLTLVGAPADADPATPPSAALAELPALRRLTVRDARLRLAPDAFRNVSGLEYLELSASELDALPAGALRGLGALRTLSLWGNELRALAPGALDGPRALDTLDLSSNPLRSLGAGALAGAPRLRVLRLVDAELDALDEPALRGLGALEELTVLDARRALAVGPRALALPALRALRLERCGVAALPADALWGARALRALSLARNALAALPARLLRDAAELRALNLSHNELRALEPALLAPLRSLEDLNLDHNRIEVFPDDLFATLGALRRLSARHNGLRVLAPLSMRGARALRELDLAHNALTLRPAGLEGEGAEGAEGAGARYDAELGAASPLDALAGLRVLDLGANLLRDVFGDWRFVMLQLELLNLTRNRFERLTDADINFLSMDVVVDLRYNNITTVQLSEALQFAMSADEGGGAGEGGEGGGGAGGARVLLDGNPFTCDCHMYGLQRRLADARARPRLEPGAAACAAPPALAGRALRAAPPGRLACALPAPACPAACACRLRPATAALELDCERAPPAAAVPAPAAFGLARTVLRLARAPAALNLTPPVHELLLPGLGLTAPPPGPAPPGLELLDLSDNRLTAVPPAPGPRLRLAGNPLACDCEHAAALAALQRAPRRVEDWRRATCAGGGPLWRVDAARLCAGAAAARAAGAGGALALLGLLAGAAAALWLRYRRELKVFLFARGWCGRLTRAAEEPAARYDVFVSFSHEDEALVARELVPALERRGYRLCVHYRDWAPGEPIARHVARSVRDARRTLVVLSRGFLRSEWARAEFRAAHARALREGRARVVVLLLGDLPPAPAPAAAPAPALAPDDDLRAYLRTNTYLKWGDPWFWEKLQYALPHKPLGALKGPAAGALSPDAIGAALAARGAPDKLAGALEPRLAPPPAPRTPPAPAL